MRGCFVTLLIVLLSVTNIILGFGLAIYFGHVRAPWATYKRTASYRPPASGEKSRESRNDFTGTIGQENDENNDESAAEAADEPAEEVVVDQVEGDASDETPEVSAEQEVLDSVETIREELHEQPELQTAVEAS